MAILVQNVTVETHLCTLYYNIDYILSHKALNDIIQYNYSFSNEDLVLQYISLLRTLSLRLNSTTLMFFFNEVKYLKILGN